MDLRLGLMVTASVLASLAGGGEAAADAPRDPRATACFDAARREDYKVVVDACAQALPVYAGKPELVAGIHSLIGVAYLRLKKFDSSIEHLTIGLRDARAVEMRAQLYFDRGAAHYHADNPHRAQIDYGNALRLAPLRADIHFERGLAFVALGDAVRAERHLEVAVAQDKDNQTYRTTLQTARQAAQTQRNAPFGDDPASPDELRNTQLAMGRQSISTDAEIRILTELKTADERRRREIASDVKRDADLYAPVMFYAIAKVEWLLGDDDEALFWWQVGELRARYDAARSADRSAGAAVGALRAKVAPGIKGYMVENADRLPALVERVLAFDGRTGFGYDHRWINAHGLASTLRPDAPTSVPESEWPARHAQARSDWAQELREAIPELLRIRDE